MPSDSGDWILEAPDPAATRRQRVQHLTVGTKRPRRLCEASTSVELRIRSRALMAAEGRSMRGFFRGSRAALIGTSVVSVVAVTIAGAMLASAAVASAGSERWVKRY